MSKIENSRKAERIQSTARVTPVEAERRRQIEMEAMKDTPPKSKAPLSTPREIILILRLARSASGLSLQEVADRMGIDAPSLSRLESFCRADRRTSEEPNPTVETLNKYAAALGKRIDVQLVDAG